MKITYITILALTMGLAMGCGPGKPAGLADQGKQLVQSKQCLTCHSLNGKKLVGPTFKGLYGKKETVIVKATGKEKEITVDDAYIEESIKNPDKLKTKGFEKQVMTVPVIVKDDEIKAIIAYLKTLK